MGGTQAGTLPKSPSSTTHSSDDARNISNRHGGRGSRRGISHQSILPFGGPKIQAACSLSPDVYEAEMPEIFI
jgi:hypothetical protein